MTFPADLETLALRDRVTELEYQLANARTRPVATTGHGLVNMVTDLLPTDLRDVEINVDVDGDGDGDLTLTFLGITLDDCGSLARRTIEFEVEGTITIPVSMTVHTTSEDEAHDLAAEILRELADGIDAPRVPEPDEIEDIDFDSFGITSEVGRVREV